MELSLKAVGLRSDRLLSAALSPTERMRSLIQAEAVWTSGSEMNESIKLTARLHSADLLDENGEPLVFEGFGELDVLSALVVDGEGSDDHVGQTSQQLPHHPVPLLLVTVVHLQEEGGDRSSHT